MKFINRVWIFVHKLYLKKIIFFVFQVKSLRAHTSTHTSWAIINNQYQTSFIYGCEK